jgi:hypothetical protein
MWFKVREQVAVIHSEDEIRQHALRHLAQVFRVPKDSLNSNAREWRESRCRYKAVGSCG